MNSTLVVGRKVSDTTSATGPHGYIEQVGGRLNTVTNSIVGAGYSDGTFTGVPLFAITGNGSGAQATVTILWRSIVWHSNSDNCW